MNLRRFLNVAYAILVEEYQRIGVPLLEAVEKLGNIGADEKPQQVVSKSQNDQALAELQARMANVK